MREVTIEDRYDHDTGLSTVTIEGLRAGATIEVRLVGVESGLRFSERGVCGWTGDHEGVIRHRAV